MIAMSVRHHNQVQLPQVDALRFRVLRKNIGVVASVEQDSFSAVFDQSSIAPVFLHRGCFTQCIIENCDLRIASSSARHWSGGYCRGTRDEKHEYCRVGNPPAIGCHVFDPCAMECWAIVVTGAANYILGNYARK